MNMAVIDTTFI